jgi:Polyketide cyclase / dehydrase and lipid transport
MTDKTTSSIAIAARRHDVMAVIADFAAYPDWATGVRAADVLTSDLTGRASRVRFQFDGGIIKDTYVLHYDWDGDAQVSWDLDEAGAVISEMSGSYQLAEQGSSTQVRYELAVGIRVPMIGIVKRRAEKMIIDAALKGLKSRAEATVGQP